MIYAKTILTVLGADQAPSALDQAIAFCRRTEAHLSVILIGVAPPPPSITYGGVPADMWVEILEEGRDKLAMRAEAVEQHLQAAAISADVSYEHCASGLVDDVIGKRARYADLTLIGPAGDDDEAIREHVIMGALFESGRPLLLLGEGQPVFPEANRIMLAWDASLEASRAAHEAIPYMTRANQVLVVLVDPKPADGHGPEPGSDIAAFLARHGIAVTIERIASSGQTVAEALLRHADDNAVDLIVMGGYGHSRLRERIFGGTTRTMLKQSRQAVFLMH